MPRRRRYKETGRGSFFGDLAYDYVLKRYREHFLVVLEKLFDWEEMSEQIIQLYKGRGEKGRPPYPPVLVFKLLFLSYLYNVSERTIVELADVHLLMIPRQHIASLAELDTLHDGLIAKMMRLLPQIAKQQGLDNGFRTIINTGPGGGQEVYHLHIHLLGGGSLPGFA